MSTNSAPSPAAARQQIGQFWNRIVTPTRPANTSPSGVLTFTAIWNAQVINNRSFGSRHPGICQFVLCDGSVRALPNSIDVTVLTRLAMRADGQVVGDF